MREKYLYSKLFKGLALMVMLCAGLLMYGEEAFAMEINVITPKERAVYQRDAKNVTDIGIEAKSDCAGLKVRVVNGQSIVNDWVTLAAANGTFTGTIPGVYAGGWYQVEFAGTDVSGNVVMTKVVEKVGVGEVFITGGQSNSCNFGGEKTQAANDTVSALNPADGSWVHCEDSQPSTSDYSTGNGGGSPWPTLGDELTTQLQVPIGFICTGRGNTKISELADDAKYYGSIKQAIDLVKPYGCRAFLIHQGEADINTDMDEYKASYEELIAKTREDAGYNLNWVIAQVSYAWKGFNDSAKAEKIKGVQLGLCNNTDIFPGPTTDDMLGTYRYKKDGLHLSLEGLIEHGKRWATALTNAYKDAFSAVPTIAPTASPTDAPTTTPTTAPDSSSAPISSLAPDASAAPSSSLAPDASATPSSSLAPGASATPSSSLAPGSSVAPGSNSSLTTGTSDAATSADTASNIKNGTTSNSGSLKFKVTSATAKTVSVTGVTKKSAKKLTIPKYIKIKGIKFKVTGINKKAFKGLGKIKKITIKSLKIKSIGKKAFANMNKNIKVKVPKSKSKPYKKMLTKAGLRKEQII